MNALNLPDDSTLTFKGFERTIPGVLELELESLEAAKTMWDPRCRALVPIRNCKSVIQKETNLIRNAVIFFKYLNIFPREGKVVESTTDRREHSEDGIPIVVGDWIDCRRTNQKGCANDGLVAAHA